MNPNEIRKLKEKAPFALIVLFILFFLPATILQPEKDLLREKVEKYDSLLKSARKNQKKRVAFIEEAKKLETFSEINRGILQQLPGVDLLPHIIDKINAAAEKNSVLVKDVTYRLEDRIEKLQAPCFSIAMNLDAYYENVRRFIVDIENLQFPLLVSEISGSGGTSYRINLKQLVK